MYEISPSWQMGLQNAAIACEIIGLLDVYRCVSCIFCRQYRRPINVTSSVWYVYKPIFIRKILTVSSGLSWGVIEILAATYSAEVVPNALRPFVLSSINMCWLVGQVIGTGILRSLVHETSQWSYRLPFALQWAWAIPLLFGVWFAPDSPCKRTHPANHNATNMANRVADTP
jgi:SP family general alpha glucoside:H+ symporter-like MFS transporter